MKNTDLSNIVEDVEKSSIDLNPILTENQENTTSLKFTRTVEIDATEENSEIPKHLLFDENGEPRVDTHGNTFDSNTHSVDEKGHPKLSPTGKLRKARAKKASSLSKSNAMQNAQNIAVSEDAKYKAIGAAASNALISLGIVLGGEDFIPIQDKNVDERNNLDSAFTEFAKTKQIEDVPPTLGLVIVLGSYILPRMTKPKQISRMKLLGLWIKAKFVKTPKGKTKSFDPNKEVQTDES